MRQRILYLIISSLFLTVILGLWHLQVAKGQIYHKLSEENRIRLIAETGPRGIIYDRNGVALVANRLSFDVMVIPQEVSDLDRILSKLSEILAIRKDRLLRSFKSGYIAPFAPVSVAWNISRDTVLILEESSLNFPGVMTQPRALRSYVFGPIASHILGYLGQISKQELENLREYGYKPRELVGYSGIEGTFNDYLRGEDGGMQIEVDHRGHQVKLLSSKVPIPGKDIYLTIDIELQKFVEELLEGNKGAVVVLDSKSGEILAMASEPEYDPNLFLSQKNNNDIKSLLSSKGSPLINRAVSSTYPPGSVFKIIVATAGLEEKKITAWDKFRCGGTYKIGSYGFSCWNLDGHGEVNVREALIRSCNVFFYQLGLKLGHDELVKWAREFELGRYTNVELKGEMKGLVPTKTWKLLKEGKRWYDGDTVNFSIGQGYLLVTPLQVARMVAVFANGGYLIKPTLIKKISGVETEGPRGKKLNISRETLEIIRDGMIGVVEEPFGTGYRAKVPGVRIAAKTGTAQLGYGRAHGWFAGFFSVGDSEISFVVFLERGGSGSETPAEIAKKIIEFYIRS